MGQRSVARHSTKRARLTTQRYHELLFALSEGVVMLSDSGHVIAANPSAEALLGMSKQEMEQALRDDAVWQAVREDGHPFPAGGFSGAQDAA